MTPSEIKALRATLGLNQTQLAKRLGLSRQATISDWETGRTEPSGPAVTLMRLLAHLHNQEDESCFALQER